MAQHRPTVHDAGRHGPLHLDLIGVALGLALAALLLGGLIATAH